MHDDLSVGSRFARRAAPPDTKALAAAAALVCLACAPWTSGSEPGSAPPVADEILNVYDAFGEDRPGVVFDFGFSALIRHAGTTLLFDAGSDGAVLEANAKALGVDLKSIDVLVLSHQHPDHTGGVPFVLAANPGVKVFAPADRYLGGPAAFDPGGPDPAAELRLPQELRYRERREGGHEIRTTGPFGSADVTYVGASAAIAPGLHLVFTRAESIGYYTAYPPHETVPRHVGLPELSLSVATPRGEVLVVGCSHAGVETIVRAARIVRRRPIELVMGGFHLIPFDAAAIEGIAIRLHEDLGVGKVAPAHCTGHLGFEALRRNFGSGFLRAGLGDRIVP